MNEKTKRLLDAYVARPNSSLLLLGGVFSGIETCVAYLTTNLLTGESKNNVIKIYPEDEKSLSIEQVREFKHAVVTSARSKEKVARIAFIFGIDTASSDAQNALLKVLEEPVDQTVIVLIAGDRKKVLPTIASRCQIVPLLPFSEKQALELASTKDIETQLAKKMFVLSSGEPLLYTQMLETSSSDDVSYLKEAKTFLQMTPFDRLQQQKNYDKSVRFEKLLSELLLLSALGMRNATNKASLKKWHGIVKEIREIDVLLKRNVLVKALFIRLCISL